MDVHASERPSSREQTLNEMIIEMLTHASPMEKNGLRPQQVEAVCAVMLLAYNNMNAETVQDDAQRAAHLHDALLQQDFQTLRVLDDLCLRFFDDLISDFRFGKANRSSAKHDWVRGSQASSTAGSRLQGLDSGESRVSRSVKQIELRLQTSVPQNQRLARVGSLQSKFRKSLPESHVLENSTKNSTLFEIGLSESPISGNLPELHVLGNSPENPKILGIGLSKSPTSGTLSESKASVNTHEDSQIPEQNLSEPADNSDQDDAEQHLRDQKEEEKELQVLIPNSVADYSNQDDAEQPLRDHKEEEEKEFQASTSDSTQSLSKPDEPGSSDQDDAEQPLRDLREEEEKVEEENVGEEKELQASTPDSPPSKSRIATPVLTLTSSPPSTPTSKSKDVPIKKSGIPLPRKVSVSSGPWRSERRDLNKIRQQTATLTEIGGIIEK
ncbi:FK506-binding protein 15 [Lobaria immixta]|nr:FK506-binding protein 15 [Lobaria immixta]